MHPDQDNIAKTKLEFIPPATLFLTENAKRGLKVKYVKLKLQAAATTPQATPEPRVATA